MVVPASLTNALAGFFYDSTSIPGTVLPWFPLEIVGRFTSPIDPIRQGIASSTAYVSRRKTAH